MRNWLVALPITLGQGHPSAKMDFVLEARRVRRLWWWLCGVPAVGLLSMPFAWRSELFVPAALGGCLLIPYLPVLFGVGLWLWLGPKAITWKHMLFGFMAIAAAIGLITPLEGVARRVLFEANYGAHRSLVRELLRTTPIETPPGHKASGRRDLTRAEAERGHVYGGQTQYVEGRLQVILDTPSGPTLEAIVFVPKGTAFIHGPRLRLVKTDDLGSWYFEVRGLFLPV
jgi:hypothetical protein